MKKYFVFTFILFYPCWLSAQQSDFERGVQSYRNGDFSAAVTYFENAKKRNPQHKDSHLFLAISYLEDDFPILAEKTAMEAFEMFENEGGFLWIAGEAYLKLNEPDRAADYYRKLFRYYEDFDFSEALQITESKIRNRWIDAELFKSSMAYQSGDLDQALDALDTALRLKTDHPQALKNRIYLLMEKEEWEQALGAIEEAESHLSEDQDLIQMKASVYYQLENLDGLLEEYRQLYNRDPKDKETAFTYADILIANQRGSEAELVIVELIEEYPDDRDVYWKLAKVQEKRMYFKEKAAALEWLLENFPGDEQALKELSATQKVLEDYDEQRKTLRDLLSVTENEEEKLNLYISISDTYLAQNNLQGAEKELQNIRTEFSGNEELLLKLGDILQSGNKWEESLEVYKEISSEQLIRKAGTQMGYAYFQLDEKQRAKEILEEVTESGIDEALAWYLLARIEYSSDRDRAYNLGLRALERGIVDLRYIRQETIENLDEQGLFADIDHEEEEFEHFRDLADRSFQFLTDHYEEDKLTGDLQSLTESLGESATLHYYLAELYDRTGNVEQVIHHAGKTIEIESSFYDAHILLGKVYRRSGDFQKAALSFERARGIQPESKSAYQNLMALYSEEGKLTELIQQWEIQFRGERGNEVFREFLIEAFHRTDQFEKAQDLLNE